MLGTHEHRGGRTLESQPEDRTSRLSVSSEGLLLRSHPQSAWKQLGWQPEAMLSPVSGGDR